MNVLVTPVPEGRALTICWEGGGAGAAGYNLYRRDTPGGPYRRLNDAPLTDTCSRDEGLTNGATYAYVVVAADALRNESARSEEVTAVPTDVVAPAPPLVFYPTTGSITLAVRTKEIEVAGFAEPGVTVELFKNGSSLGRTTALAAERLETFSLPADMSAPVLSPDGKTLLYGTYSDNGLWLLELATGSRERILTGSTAGVWSPRSDKIAYLFTDQVTWSQRIGVYDLGTGASTPLTDGAGSEENYPSWSEDGTRIVFLTYRDDTYGIYAKNLATGELSLLVADTYVSSLKLAPDGSRLAYTIYDTLYLVDLASVETSEVASGIQSGSLAWSPDGARLAALGMECYYYYYCTPRRVLVVDPATLTVSEAAYSAELPLYPEVAWSPDGRALAYGSSTYSRGDEVRTVPVDGSGEARLVQQVGIYSLTLVSWARSGEVAVGTQASLYLHALPGHFRFTGAPVESGEQVFHATAADAYGNVSAPSAPISVTVLYDMPDLATTAEDIFVYPATPIAGEEVAVTATVWNRGSRDAEEVQVDISLLDSSGNLELLKSATIPLIPAGASEQVSVTWDSTGRVGEAEVLVFVDPGEKIAEISEANNSTSWRFYVAGGEGVALGLVLDGEEYGSGRDVRVDVALHNSGQPRNVEVEVRIEDGQGVPVATLGTFAATVGYGAEERRSYTWNTGATYAGPYRARAALREAGAVAAEQVVPFAIRPDLLLLSSVGTDRIVYNPGEEVLLQGTVESKGLNYDIPSLEARLVVRAADGTELLRESREIQSLLAGSAASLGSVWKSGASAAGAYQARVEVYLAGALVSVATVDFTVEPLVKLSGTLAVTPSLVSLGGEVRADYTVSGSGNVAVGAVTVQCLLVDPRTETPVSSQEEALELGLLETRAGRFGLSTVGAVPGTYRVVLQALHEGETRTLAAAALTVKDGSAPVVEILSPASGTVFDGAVPLLVRVGDDSSGVERVEYQVDERGWRPLAAVDPATARYGAAWDPTAADQGTHVIRFRAADRAGNLSQPVSTSVVIQLVSPFRMLTGTIAAASDPVYFGREETFLYTITNPAAGGVAVRAQVVIFDGADREVKRTAPATLNLGTGTHTASAVISTADLPPATYRATLLVVSVAGGEARTLAGTSFRVVPSLEVSKHLFEEVNLLVWVNEPCCAKAGGSSAAPGCGHDRCDSTSCLRMDLLAGALKNAAAHYLLVSDREDFERELRNPFYTDILILGSRQPLDQHLGAELSEKVNAGMGIVSSLWIKHMVDLDSNSWEDSPIFGVKWEGLLSGRDHQVDTLTSPVTTEGSLPTKGTAAKVEALAGATVVGCMSKEQGNSQKGRSGSAGPRCSQDVSYPAIVLNEYGLGKAVYYAFDLGLSFTDGTSQALADLLRKSLAYVHRPLDPEDVSFPPNRLVPVEITVKSLGGAFDVQVSEDFPGELALYDPAQGQWRTESPWTVTFHLGPDETKALRYYYLPAETAGTYTTTADVGFLAGGVYTHLESLSTEFAVPRDTAGLIGNVITALGNLAVAKQDKMKVQIALWRLQRVLERPPATAAAIEENIYDIIRAIDSVLLIGGADVSGIRLMLDELLQVEEGLYYYFGSEEGCRDAPPASSP